MGLLAGGCLIAGIAIGLTIPRSAPRPLSRLDETRRNDGAASPAIRRNVYSPDIRNDAFVRQEQLRIVDMLEQQCRATRENCDVAKASRDALTRD